MNRSKKINSKISPLLFLFLLLFGCEGNLAFRSGHLQGVTLTSTESDLSNRKSISIIIGAEGFKNGKEDDQIVELKDVREQILNAYRQSNLFSDIKPGLSDADLYAEIKILEQEEYSSFLSILSNLTFGIIPGYGTNNLNMKTIVKNRDGKVLGTFENSEKLKYISHLIFYFLPVPYLASLSKDTLYQLSRVTIDQAHTKGIF